MGIEGYRVDWDGLPWEDVAPGMRSKVAQGADQELRLLELSTGFEEVDWCTKGHAGFVLKGELEIRFDGRTVCYQAGDGLLIPPGQSHRHRAVPVSEVVELLLIEAVESEA